MENFCDSMDLLLDASKTFFWSTDPTERAAFREQNKRIEQASRDLGGHVQYSRQTTNFTITQKISSLDRWPQLARSKAPRSIKLRALRTAVWPNIFHGVASVHLGDTHHEHLRTSIMKCINDAQPGVSPTMVLSLFENPLNDPGYFALWSTVQDFRHHTTQERCEEILDSLKFSNRVRPKPGPCSVLLHRLHQVGWYWEAGTFHDQWGDIIHLWDCCAQEIGTRLAEAWQQMIAQQLGHRKTMQGVEHIHAYTSRLTLPAEGSHKATLRRNMTGAFLTPNYLHKRDTSQSDQCPFCQAPDSPQHRIWECEALEQARKSCPPETRERIQQLPQVSKCHGWIQMPPSVQTFRQTLLAQPDNHQATWVPESLPDHLELFTDGSCRHPHCKCARLCTWSVVTSTNSGDFVPVASDLLGGYHQTINRAELRDHRRLSVRQTHPAPLQGLD